MTVAGPNLWTLYNLAKRRLQVTCFCHSYDSLIVRLQQCLVLILKGLKIDVISIMNRDYFDNSSYQNMSAEWIRLAVLFVRVIITIRFISNRPDKEDCVHLQVIILIKEIENFIHSQRLASPASRSRGSTPKIWKVCKNIKIDDGKWMKIVTFFEDCLIFYL